MLKLLPYLLRASPDTLLSYSRKAAAAAAA
jgi:hypothetical protein